MSNNIQNARRSVPTREREIEVIDSFDDEDDDDGDDEIPVFLRNRNF